MRSVEKTRGFCCLPRLYPHEGVYTDAGHVGQRVLPGSLEAARRLASLNHGRGHKAIVLGTLERGGGVRGRVVSDVKRVGRWNPSCALP